eukprot:15442049-Alexandrium_andersonii.AAC.1
MPQQGPLQGKSIWRACGVLRAVKVRQPDIGSSWSVQQIGAEAAKVGGCLTSSAAPTTAAPPTPSS